MRPFLDLLVSLWVRRVIRNRSTGHYLAKEGNWCAEYQKAHEFPGVARAIEMLQHHQLRDCDLVLQMGPEPSAEFDVVLPLMDSKPYERAKPSRETERRNLGGVA